MHKQTTLWCSRLCPCHRQWRDLEQHRNPLLIAWLLFQLLVIMNFRPFVPTATVLICEALFWKIWSIDTKLYKVRGRYVQVHSIQGHNSTMTHCISDMECNIDLLSTEDQLQLKREWGNVDRRIGVRFAVEGSSPRCWNCVDPFWNKLAALWLMMAKRRIQMIILPLIFHLSFCQSH